jgi:hypothetical protein
VKNSPILIRTFASLLFLARSSSPNSPRQSFPDPKLTPGDSFAVSFQDLCEAGYTKKVRDVPAEIRREVYEEYGVAWHGPDDYEVDHLIPLELGGSNYDQKSLAGIPPDLAVEMPKETGRIPVPRRSGPERIPPANVTGE